MEDASHEQVKMLVTQMATGKIEQWQVRVLELLIHRDERLFTVAAYYAENYNSI